VLEHKDHSERDDLTGEHKYGDAGQVVLLIVFLAVWIIDSFVAHYTDFPAQYVPLWMRLIAGGAILISSGYIARTGLNIVFDKSKTHTGVIREGLFNRVRHPVYLGSMLFYLGLTAITLSIATAIIWLAGLVFYNFISAYEEKLLLERFGNEYKSYMTEVPRWFPRLRIR
jgi:protein-S-isoprenylcysteine O-methyltransferase Ste14